MNPIELEQLGRPLLPETSKSKPGNGEAPEASFGKLLRESMAEVNRYQQESDKAAEALATGRQTDIHQAMIAMEKSEISFKLLMEVRNKIVAAYDEIRRMPV